MDINYDGDLSKTRTCFRKNTTVFLENYVRVFGKSRTCFPKNMYDFSKKHVRVFGGYNGDRWCKATPVVPLGIVNSHE